MSKLFFVKTESNIQIGYIHYKNFNAIYALSAILLLGGIPLLVFLLSSEPITQVILSIVTVLLIVVYIKLWQGKSIVILEYDNNELVTIYDNDLIDGKITFNLKNLNTLDVKSETSTHQTGMFGNKSNYTSAALLHITFDNGGNIAFGSNTYGGQLRMIKKYLMDIYKNKYN